MKALRIFILLVMLGVMVNTGTSQEADNEPLFTLQTEEPAVLPGRGRDWDGKYTDPGAVFYHDGQFHMFRNGFRGWVAPVQIGYLTSPDGITWTEVTEDPVLTTDEVPFAGTAALASTAFVEADGTWVLYFYTWESYSSANSSGTIGRATADNPLGPWTVHPEPLLTPGSAGSWDDAQLTSPKITRTEEGYWMYYTGFHSEMNFSGQIGLAFSEDGLTWTKYDDPATTDPLLAESDPVLAGEENVILNQSNVFQTDNGWVMLYRSVGSDRQMTINYATSADGIVWTPSENNPIWEKNTIPRSSGFWFTDAVLHDNTYYLYIEGAYRAGTAIFVATHEGNLE